VGRTRKYGGVDVLYPRVEGDDGGVQVGNIVLTDRQIPVKYIQELALDPTDITLSEDASRDCPVDVLKGGIIREL